MLITQMTPNDCLFFEVCLSRHVFRSVVFWAFIEEMHAIYRLVGYNYDSTSGRYDCSGHNYDSTSGRYDCPSHNYDLTSGRG